MSTQTSDDGFIYRVHSSVVTLVAMWLTIFIFILLFLDKPFPSSIEHRASRVKHQTSTRQSVSRLCGPNNKLLELRHHEGNDRKRALRWQFALHTKYSDKQWLVFWFCLGCKPAEICVHICWALVAVAEIVVPPKNNQKDTRNLPTSSNAFSC